MSIMDKPRAVEKLRSFQKSLRRNGGKVGTSPRVIEFVYNNQCNFQCQHCSTRAALGDNSARLMPFDKIVQIADEADELGFFELHLHGGELLVHPEAVFSLLEAIGPDRFYTFLTTNGYVMTQDLANRLAAAGVNRVSVSIDSMNPEAHDRFRGQPGAHAQALKALEYVKNAGMQPYMNITVGHYNAFSQDLVDMLEYSANHGYITFLNIAIPSGCWKGNFEVMIDEADRAHLIELRKKYKNINRDLWDPFDRNYEKSMGCQTMNKIYVTPSGDVLPCSFVHIKVGNLYEQSLRDIIQYGFSVRYFRQHCETCLAGEEQWFAEKYLSGEMSMQNPMPAADAFAPEDFLVENTATTKEDTDAS